MMGGTVVRASGSCYMTTCLLHYRHVITRSSTSVSPRTAAFCPSSFISISFSSSRDPGSLRSFVVFPSALGLQHSLLSSSSSACPSGSRMNSRLATPVFSYFCETRLQPLTSSKNNRRRSAPNLMGPGYVGNPNCFSQSRKWCWRETRFMQRSRAKKNKGRTIDCCSSQAGSDQPASSVLPLLQPVAKAKGLRISFCPRCGGATEEKIPVGEHEMRFVCTACGSIHYQNPKMVVGCLVEHEEQVLLCRRNIEPSYGLWTLPAGYMEIGESAAEGAARETLEEACADVQVLGLFAHLDIPFIGQSYIIFRAQLKDPYFAPGAESLECALFKINEIPFDHLAFSSIHVALKLYVEDIKAGKLKVHHGVIDKRPGASPSDIKGFAVRDLLCS